MAHLTSQIKYQTNLQWVTSYVQGKNNSDTERLIWEGGTKVYAKPMLS